MSVARALLVVLLVVLAGCAGTAAPTPTPTPAATETVTPPPTPSATATPTPPSTPVPSATFVIDGEARATVALEVADSPDERRRGLMNRTSLPRNHGMVFVYAAAGSRTFWMQNTLIALDMIFVGADGVVLNVEHAAVQPNASAAELRRYHSDGPAKYVIEVNRGFANRTGVGPGTRVRFHGPPSLLTPEG